MSFYKHYIFTRNSHLKRRKLLYEWNLRTYVQGPWALKESKINTVLMVRGGLKKETFLYFPHFHSLFLTGSSCNLATTPWLLLIYEMHLFFLEVS